MILKINGLTYDEIHNKISQSENVFDVLARKIQNIPYDFNGNTNLIRIGVNDELELVSNLFEINVLRTTVKVFEIASDNIINFIDLSLQFLLQFI